MIVPDTDVLTILQSASGGEFERLVRRLDDAPDRPVYVTIVSFEEQMRGWLAYIARSKVPDRQVVAYQRLRRLVDDYRKRPILDYDTRAALEFGQLVQRRIRIGTMDLKIAAIVLSQGAKLISRNLADFRKVPGLTVEDWAA